MRRRQRARRGRGPAHRLLHHGPAHGYTLLKQLEAFGLLYLDPSVGYRTLRDMEEKGWVTSTWDEEQAQGPPRRVYSLTALGDGELGRHTQELQEMRATIDRLIQAYQRHMEEGEGEHHSAAADEAPGDDTDRSGAGESLPDSSGAGY
jgi:DNA-binding PadR family transcriptional regulator